MRVIEAPVLIVGGGAAGLTASSLMAALGVESLLVERHPETSHLPKAHLINQRTMELFRQIGIAEAIYAKGPRPDQMGKVIWHTSLGGDGPLDRKVIHAADAFGSGRYASEHAEKSAARTVNVPQLRLEPVLREFAEAANPGRVLFNHELVRFSDDGQGVEAIIRDRASGEEIGVKARYLIGADGGKTVGPAVGVTMEGPTDLADYVGIYFAADLSDYIPDDTSVMRIILHIDQQPGRPPAGGLLAQGPTRWDRHSEEWAIGWGYAPNDPDRLSEDNMEDRVRAFLKVDVPVTIKHISHWKMEAVVASQFRFGNAFLVGDAAHRHTPGGGLGLNSAVQDVQNLCWKLAAVLKGHASDALLDSYEPERKPVVTRNAQNSLLAFGNHFTYVSAMGLMPGAPSEMNFGAMAQFFADTPDGRQRRARLQATFDAIVCSEYAPHDLEMGYQYDSAAIVQDGTPWPDRDPLGSHYVPSSHPGCRMPHAWLHVDGQAAATHDLAPAGSFLLFAGENGGAWVDAANRISAARDLPLRAIRVGPGGGATDPTGAWARLSETGPDGVLLVRPDGHVAFRAAQAPADAEEALSNAFNAILAVPAVKALETAA